MRQMRADAAIPLQREQRLELEKVARSRRTPQAVAQRVRIVLLTADGVAPNMIGEQLGVSQPTIRKWRARYVSVRPTHLDWNRAALKDRVHLTSKWTRWQATRW